MNFFEYQDKARRNTIWLVILFICGVVATIGALYAAIVLIMIFTGWSPGLAQSPWSPSLLVGVAALTLLIILFGSGSKFLALRGGGKAVAESLGGKHISFDSNDPDEQQLINVVEEMAIASGTPVPDLYVLEEEGINAFAAGKNLNDAVIGVTRGCLKHLNRDELQGVIAHEFSHIVNQDMRINMRLIAVIAGLIMISIMGRQLLFSMRYSMLGSSRGRGGQGGKGKLAILLIGLAFLIVGALGVFFSRMIKAAISRQREYLADASAVQFTRHPDGLAGALKKIGEHTGRIEHPKREEASHMFFGDALSRSGLSRLSSTHPPLKERIKRLDPSFEGEEREAAAAGEAEGPAGVSMLSAPGGRPPDLNIEASRMTEEVGTISVEKLQHGKEIVKRLPEELRRAAHDPLGAVALTYALVLDDEQEHHDRQWAILEERVPPSTLEEIEQLEPAIHQLDPWLALPLAEILLPSLRNMSREQYAQFASTLRALILHDEELSLFQFALSKMVLHQLEGRYEKERGRYKLISSVHKASPYIRQVLSVLADAGSQNAEELKRNFSAGLERLPDYADEPVPTDVSFAELNEALDRLARSSPKVKEKVIDACAHVALANESVSLEEAELLRVFAATLDCPLPPFVPRAQTA